MPRRNTQRINITTLRVNTEPKRTESTNAPTSLTNSLFRYILQIKKQIKLQKYKITPQKSVLFPSKSFESILWKACLSYARHPCEASARTLTRTHYTAWEILRVWCWARYHVALDASLTTARSHRTLDHLLMTFSKVFLIYNQKTNRIKGKRQLL